MAGLILISNLNYLVRDTPASWRPIGQNELRARARRTIP